MRVISEEMLSGECKHCLQKKRETSLHLNSIAQVFSFFFSFFSFFFFFFFFFPKCNSENKLCVYMKVSFLLLPLSCLADAANGSTLKSQHWEG